MPVALHFLLKLAFFLPVDYYIHSYLENFVPVGRHFRSELAIFELSIFGPVASHFGFDLVIFEPIAYHFCLDLLNFVVGAHHFCGDLSNFSPVAYNSLLDLAMLPPVLRHLAFYTACL